MHLRFQMQSRMRELPLILPPQWVRQISMLIAFLSDGVLVWGFFPSTGYHFSMLDVGGGFPGSSQAPLAFKDIANVLNASIEEHFPKELGIRIIAEPGRYYVSSCATLVTNVIGKRTIKPTPNADPMVDLLLSLSSCSAF